jgi:hypothetical protein
MHKTTKWTVATFCLDAVAFGFGVGILVLNTLISIGLIFYATLVEGTEKNYKLEVG